MLRTILRAIRPLGEEADHPRLLGVNAKAVSQRRNRVIERKRKSHRLVLSVVTSVLADKGNIGRMGRNVNRYRQTKGGRRLLVLKLGIGDAVRRAIVIPVPRCIRAARNLGHCDAVEGADAKDVEDDRPVLLILLKRATHHLTDGDTLDARLLLPDPDFHHEAGLSDRIQLDDVPVVIADMQPQAVLQAAEGIPRLEGRHQVFGVAWDAGIAQRVTESRHETHGCGYALLPRHLRSDTHQNSPSFSLASICLTSSVRAWIALTMPRFPSRWNLL